MNREIGALTQSKGCLAKRKAHAVFVDTARTLTLLFSAFGAAEGIAGQSSHNSAAVALVLAAERRGCRAYEHHDVEGLRAFLTADYTLTDSRGLVTTRQDDLDDFLKNRVRYSTFENKNMAVRIHGGTAIVTGQTVVRGTTPDRRFDVEVQFTDTLVYEQGRWRLAAGHVSRLRDK